MINLSSYVENLNKEIKSYIEVKNNLTMVRGEWGGDSEERGLQGLV